MKEIFYFLKWHWDKWSWSMRLYILAAGFFGSGIAEWVNTGQLPWQIYVAWTVMGTVLVKWLFWDTTIASWKTYKKEKADLFKTIEEGK